jgi:hypothetical protein
MRFDRDSPEAVDSSGNGNNGTLHGPSFTQGLFGGALSFDGVNDYVDIPADSSLAFTDMTLSARILFPDSIQTGWRTILEHDRWGGNWYGLYKSYYGDNFHFRWNSPGTEDFTTTISPDAWHHLAGTFDSSSGKARLYQDGELDSEVTGASSPIPNDANLRIGMNNADSEPLRAIIDEIAVWSRPLSQEEVRELHSRGALYCLPGEFHRADTSPRFGCISTDELVDFISLWHGDSEEYGMPELMEGVGFWKSRQGCS